MTNGLSNPKRNAAAGFIRPNGTFVDLQRGSHPSDARSMGTSLPALLKKGWIRKAGQGAYEGNFTAVTLRAIEADIITDYEDLKLAGDFGTPGTRLASKSRCKRSKRPDSISDVPSINLKGLAAT